MPAGATPAAHRLGKLAWGAYAVADSEIRVEVDGTEYPARFSRRHLERRTGPCAERGCFREHPRRPGIERTDVMSSVEMSLGAAFTEVRKPALTLSVRRPATALATPCEEMGLIGTVGEIDMSVETWRAGGVDLLS